MIHELTPDRADDFLQLFDGDTFADNPAWAKCYCMFYHHDGSERGWNARNKAQNRALKLKLVRAAPVSGLLAYEDGRPVGYCNAMPRTAYPQLARDPALAMPDEREVGSIVCFIIAPAYRRRGIGKQLLAAACDSLRRAGLRVAEAYPRKQFQTAHQAHHGPLGMFLNAGFRAVKDLGDAMIVRKDLAG